MACAANPASLTATLARQGLTDGVLVVLTALTRVTRGAERAWR